MTELGITEADKQKIEDAIENGFNRLRNEYPSQNSSPEKEQLVETLKEMQRKGFQEVKSRSIARYIDEDISSSQIGKTMSSLAMEGHVDRIGEESPYQWKIAKDE